MHHNIISYYQILRSDKLKHSWATWPTGTPSYELERRTWMKRAADQKVSNLGLAEWLLTEFSCQGFLFRLLEQDTEDEQDLSMPLHDLFDVPHKGAPHDEGVWPEQTASVSIDRKQNRLVNA